MYSEPRISTVKLGLLSKPASKHSGNAIPGELLELLCPLDNDRVKTASPTSVIASLTTFPLEIWAHILLLADLETITTFRAVSHAARTLVDNIPRYRDIVAGFPNLLRAALCTRVASWLSVTELHHALFSTSCVNCKKSGEYIHLLSCCRICRHCLQGSKRMRPLTLAEARERYVLSPGTLALVPQILTIPGKYNRRPMPIGHRITLLDRATLCKMVEKQPPESGHSPRTIHSLAEHLPFMWALRTPWVDRKSNTAHWGYRCRPCAEHGSLLAEEPVTYDRQRFLEHVEACNPARNVWAAFSPSR